MQANKYKQNVMRFFMVFVGISGCFSVLFGAWLAHAGQTLAPHVQTQLQTALQYQLLHTLALLSILVWAIKNTASNILLAAAISFFIGILCFSGTIYLKTLFSFALLGKLTPMGGISLALAWLLLSLEGMKKL